MNQTIEQKRAKYALNKVKAAALKKDENGNFLIKKSDYKSYAVQFPIMIQQSGLGQTCAFYRSRSDDNHDELFKLLQGWLCKSDADEKYQKTPIFSKHKDLLDAITESDQHLYRLAQAEAQSLLLWVARFVKVYMNDEATDSKTQEETKP